MTDPTPTAETGLSPEWRALDVPRIARCLHCRTWLSAHPGDTHSGRQQWRHHNRNSWGSSWCVLDPTAGVYTMAQPDLSTIEWVKSLFSNTATIAGYRASWPFVIRYGEANSKPLVDLDLPPGETKGGS